MKKLIATTFAASALAVYSQATVNFSLDIELLKDGSGTALSNSGLLLLVVDADDNGIDLPSDGSYGEDVIASWDLSSVGPGETAITLFTKGGVEIDPDWNVDETLALVWFPELSDGQLPSATEPYGIFSDGLGLSSGDPWLMPADGTLLHKLKFFSSEATALSAGGDLPGDAGLASFSVDNPPSMIANPSISMVANSGSGEAVVSWDAPATEPAGGYVIRRRIDGAGPYVTVGFADGTATSFSDDSIKAGLEYEYTVLALEGPSFLAASSSSSVEAERSVFFGVSIRSTVVVDDASQHVFGGVVLAPDPDDVSVTTDLLFQGVGRDKNDPNGLEGDTHLADPTVQIYDQIVNDWAEFNDDWLANEPATAMAIDDLFSGGTGVPLPADSDNHDAAILRTGEAEANANLGYAFVVSPYEEPTSGSPKANHNETAVDGDVLLAVYDAGYQTRANKTGSIRIKRLAVRGMVSDTQFFGMVGGLDIRGNVPKQVLLMGFGPYFEFIGDSTIQGKAITNPTLKLRLAGTLDVVAENDDWATTSPSTASQIVVETDSSKVLQAIEAAGYNDYDSYPTDSAILATFDPGVYTVELVGYSSPDVREAGLSFLVIDEVELDL